MINVNPYCESCVKASVCEWNQKLYKLEGTEKKCGVLEITVTGCSQFLSVDGKSVEEEPED